MILSQDKHLIMQPLLPVIINPQNVIALDLDSDEHYVLTPKPVLRATPKLVSTKTNSNCN